MIHCIINVDKKSPENTDVDRIFLKISISIREFFKISMAINYYIDRDLAYQAPVAVRFVEWSGLLMEE